jgi:hypothetical protein
VLGLNAPLERMSLKPWRHVGTLQLPKTVEGKAAAEMMLGGKELPAGAIETTNDHADDVALDADDVEPDADVQEADPQPEPGDPGYETLEDATGGEDAKVRCLDRAAVFPAVAPAPSPPSHFSLQLHRGCAGVGRIALGKHMAERQHDIG